MAPQVCEREGFTVVGWTSIIDPQHTDWTALWEDDIMPHGEAIQLLATGEDWFGVYFGFA